MMSLVKVMLQHILLVFEFLISMFAKVLWSTLQVLELVMSICTAVFESMVSPLEIGACIAVVDVNEANNCFQISAAVITLLLAVCDWHVPCVFSYHNFLCRFLSVIYMQMLFPYSLTFTGLAFLYPTFGKRAHSIPTSASELGVGASEHVSTSAEDKTSIDDVIAKLNAAGHDDPRGAELLAAAITLRDSSGRDRQAALRSMANTWGVT
jgi:hypothetical protein